MSCTTYKSIQIDFQEPSIKPANGYIVKYRVIGTTEYTTLTPNPMGSPVVIPNVPSCQNVEGTIATNCDGNEGQKISFVAAGFSTPGKCESWSVTEPITDGVSVFRYIPCGQTTAVTLSLQGKKVTGGICAEDSLGLVKVFGEASIQREGTCTTNNIVSTPF